DGLDKSAPHCWIGYKVPMVFLICVGLALHVVFGKALLLLFLFLEEEEEEVIVVVWICLTLMKVLDLIYSVLMWI
nr:hypothetical protein [Tanacetum cinerariifolium]